MNKVALVTGASSGIGLDVALRLLDEGFSVYAAARRVELMKEITGHGGTVLALDLCSDDSMVECVNTVIEKAGRIDVLVNNAGYGLGGSIEDIPLSEARRQFDVNVFGLGRMIQLVLPQMRKQRSGTIINVSSMAGIFSSPFTGWYHASKYCVEALSDALRNEVRPFGIKVAVIEPGQIQTDWGIIHGNSIRKYSGSTAYSVNAGGTAEWYERGFLHNKNLTKPKVISDLIIKAAKAKNPKTRYRGGKGSKAFIFLRRISCDKVFDLLLAINLHLKNKL